MTVDLTEIQKKLNKVACPLCKQSKIDVKLRCDLGYGECLAVAECGNCGTVYEVSTERSVLDQGKKDCPDPICPECHGSDVDLEMRCELPSRRCFYIVHCKPCDHPFVPKKI